MKALVPAIFGILITCTYGQVGSISQTPNKTMWENTTKFEIQINKTVNPPSFSAFICFIALPKNESVYCINSKNGTQVFYNNTTITFHTENYTARWSTNFTYYITFDEGVFFSDENSNSTAVTDSTFWTLEVTEGYSTTTSTVTTSTETARIFPRGEPPPTRSAKLGMGLGITFIAVLLICEIMYFQCFYRGGLRNRHYGG